MKLTAKQARFVEEYLVDLNATQAAVRAGYSARTARRIGSENLSKPDIFAAIETAMKSRSERVAVTQDMVATELAKIGFSDIGNIVTTEGHLIDLHDMDEHTRRSIEVVTVPNGEVDEEGRKKYDHVKKVKLWDKPAALYRLGMHLGMFRQKVDVRRDFDEQVKQAFKTVAERSVQIGRQIK